MSKKHSLSLTLLAFLGLTACGVDPDPSQGDVNPVEMEWLNTAKKTCSSANGSWEGDVVLCQHKHYLKDKINDHRKKMGLPFLVEAKELFSVSLEWACYLSQDTEFLHSSWQQSQRRVGFIPGGENIIFLGSADLNKQNVDRLFDLWLDSSPHRKQIESPNFSYSGLALCLGHGNLSAVQQFSAGRFSQSQ